MAFTLWSSKGGSTGSPRTGMRRLTIGLNPAQTPSHISPLLCALPAANLNNFTRLIILPSSSGLFSSLASTFTALTLPSAAMFSSSTNLPARPGICRRARSKRLLRPGWFWRILRLCLYRCGRCRRWRACGGAVEGLFELLGGGLHGLLVQGAGAAGGGWALASRLSLRLVPR